ncbi:hypothetical protein [Mycobacteroides abscessus]|uniref:hypothetical protein n=2 Tax=Mycobacteroides abscessus TaxID=36809 RepID=UPI0009A6A708|nr:hypothetical protein [Mycobacteroides abscessus]
MMKLYGPYNDDTCGYRIAHDGNRWRWWWIEPGEDPDFSSEFDIESKAYRDAARDWDENGCGVPKLTGTLKAIATKLEKAGR